MLARVLHLVDAVASVDEASNGRQVGGSPCPTEEAKAALLGLDSIGVGASERLAQLGVGQAGTCIIYYGGGYIFDLSDL